MDLIMLELVISYVNIFLEFTSIVFITFVFFDLVFLDRNIKLSGISEKFQKFKRYDIFKSSLFFLVLTFYFLFFGKIAIFFRLPELTFTIFALIANIFLLVFVFKLYQILRKYVVEEEVPSKKKK